MEKKYQILLVTSLIIIVHNVLYLKFVVYDNNKFYEYWFKWIPTMLLMLQTLYFCLLVPENMHYRSATGICLSVGYFFCMIGDIVLIFPYETTYLVGILLFLSAYLVFGISKTYYIIRYWSRNYIFPVVVGIGLIFLAQILYVSYLIHLFKNTVIMIGAVIVYSFFINFSVSCQYIYLIVNTNSQALVALLGIFMFGTSDCLLIYHDIYYPNIWLEMICLLLYWLGLTILGWSVYQKTNTSINLIKN